MGAMAEGGVERGAIREGGAGGGVRGGAFGLAELVPGGPGVLGRGIWGERISDL